MTVSGEDRNLCELVLAEFPEAYTTAEIVQQLAEHLPITSTDEIARRLDGVITVGDQPFPIGRIAEHVPSAIYPIESLEQLVEIVAFVVRIAPPVAADTRTPHGLRLIAAKLSTVGYLQGVPDECTSIGTGQAR